ncbi:serine/threonine-protein kinase [Streptomyces sp. NPDC006984]|uniref:serine/threonine-protein kinase n=1 Tax=Streptomyces sp. NPDC006984 TaxID=3155463 RepID=UPI0033EEB8E6
MNDGEPGRRVIDGRFELQARLGGGGMGMVWRARDLVLDRAVALKEVRPPDPGLAEYDPEAAALLRARVLREARALARVDHPNVVTIHHVVDGDEHAYPWFVMELVTGGSLADLLARGPMEPREAARLGREVLSALRAAHAAGIQHRDVKPANVLLRPDGRPVLTDFGIAAIRESTALTATGSVIGTPDFMAPERISGGDGGPESDIWSLAMMLYVAVEGHHPLRKGSTLATLAAVLSEELPPPRQAGPLAPALRAILVKDASVRPDAAAVDELLRRAEEDDQVPAAPAGGPATSYHLTPPTPPAGGGYGTPTPPPGGVFGAPTPPTAGGYGAPAGGYGPPATAPVLPAGADGARRGVRRRRGVAVGAAAVSVALTGALVWAFLPDGGDEDPGGAKGRGTVATGSPGTSATPGADPVDAEEQPEETTDLLTPDGIRTAVDALKEAAGTDRMSRLAVYPEHVSANVMVGDSKTRYDSWTYRPGQGAEKGIISGSVTSMESAFDVDDFDWDAVPALFARAEKELNVTDATSRYLLVEGDDPTFGDPQHMSAYLSNDYSEVGYLTADPKGKVTLVMPHEDRD